MVTVKKLENRQIFGMRNRANLEKRITDHFHQSRDAIRVIFSVIAISVRNGLSTSDFSFMAKDLIRSLFLENEEILSIPLSCVYFRDYFNDSEWQTVINRLFSSQEEYEQLTESTRLYLEDLRPLLNSGEFPTEKKTNMISYFKDANGKRHSWSLSNVNPNITNEEHYALLSILGTLTIFEKDGVRRFVEPIYADFMTYEPSFDSRSEEEAMKLQAKAGKLLPITTQKIEEGAHESDTKVELTSTSEATDAGQEAGIDTSTDKISTKKDTQGQKDSLKTIDRSTIPDSALKTYQAQEDQLKTALTKEEIQLEPEKRTVPISPEKPLSNKERYQKLLEQKNRNKQSKQGLLNQLNKRGKKRK
ncbi:hypothetical protein [Enterococcus sp. AZ163]|uniref:hypothetical protein n=1 Tax=Enterococcus sp. AZ163 TaxID=2774638 RepID=UPI003D292D1C